MSTVQEDRMVVHQFFKNIPDRRIKSLDHLLGKLGGLRDLLIYEFIDDERFVKLNGHFSRNTALVHLEIRSDSDNRSSGEVDTLT